MEKERRVVITGMGVITPIGNDIETFRRNLMNGVCGISPLHFEESKSTEGLRVRLAASVKDFKPAEYGMTPQEVRKADLFSQYATCAAMQAVKMSGIEVGVNVDPERIGVFVGSGIGGLQVFVKQTKVMLEEGAGFVSPLFIPTLIANMGSANISIKLGAKGACNTNVSACASGTNAVGEAFLALKRGDADVILTGGSDAAISPLSLGGFQNARALSLEEDPALACLPFDSRRSGFVMGEGAGVLVLEEYEHALARGAEMFAEVCGYSNTSDAFHITAPAADALQASRAMREALAQAKYAGEPLYINAHGTGTHLNDSLETKAIKLALGEEQARKAIISSTKSMHGHMLGATGAVELIASAFALKYGEIPPTIGLTSPDPECDLDYTPLVSRKADVTVSLSNSLGFGGHNSAVVLRKI